MIQKLTFMLLAIFLSQAALSEELATGIVVSSASAPINEYRKPTFALKREGSSIKVSITDFFYSSGPFDQPWVTSERAGKLTLHVGTKKKSGLFQTKDEYVRTLVLSLERSVAPKGATLYILNEDSGEILGHKALP